MPTPGPNFVDIYVDETSQTKHRFLGLGALLVRSDGVESFCEVIRQARLPDLPAGEMAWGKVSRSKLPAYRRVVDLFFEPPQGLNNTQFHTLIIDTSRLNDRAFNGGSREVGFNKEIYQLLQKAFRLNRNKLFHAYLDSRTTNTTLDDLTLISNRGARKLNPNADTPFRRVQFKESTHCACLQTVDILLGGLAFHLNGHRQAEGASPAKCELSDYILDRARIRDPFQSTSIAGRFTVWHRQLL